MRRRRTVPTAAALAATLLLPLAAAGCGSGGGASGGSSTVKPNQAEVNPAGDIPDNQAYVRVRPAGAGYSVKVPEGWSQSSSGGATTFTDKLNAIRLESAPATAARTAAQIRQTLLPRLAASVKGFQSRGVTVVQRRAGPAVRIAYLAQATPNAVTGKAGVDAVERYVFFHNGRDAVLTLSGPKGADNVDPWRIVTDSVAWSR